MASDLARSDIRRPSAFISPLIVVSRQGRPGHPEVLSQASMACSA
jgi:hypothetical protein